uniref:Peptidase M50 domain-containing protein n=1 Tax=Mantoniella antarctica TaxID=81844 RepID=A0A6U3EJW3_9CHLO|mmetsp:Transcript_14803/g.36234  ORF Transcript_14803/g.36234 Transcript_14803/m.36234 type:complete len:773 (+) Transcript_14803:223-2541(+)
MSCAAAAMGALGATGIRGEAAAARAGPAPCPSRRVGVRTACSPLTQHRRFAPKQRNLAGAAAAADRRRASGTVAVAGRRARRGNVPAPTAARRMDPRSAVRCRGFFDNLKNAFGSGSKKESDGDEEDNEEITDVAVEPEAGSSTSAGAAAPPPPAPTAPAYIMPKADYQSTMSALDALLPPDEAETKRQAQDAADEARAAQLAAKKNDPPEGSVDISVSISPAALEALRDAESARRDGGAPPPGLGKSSKSPEMGADGKPKDKDAWLNSVVDGLSDSASKDRGDRTDAENAKLDKVLADLADLAKKGKEDRSSDEIRAKFDSLFEILEITDDPPVPPEDVQRLKDEVFGYNTFWVTGVEELGPEISGEGVLIKGNLRADRAEVWEKVQESVERIFAGKYTPFMLEEPGGFLSDDDGGSPSGSYDANDPRGTNSRGPRVSFLIVPSDKAGPNPKTSAWQYVVAIVLFALTAGSALQLGLVAEVSRLPLATMDWLAQGQAGLENTLAPGEIPPGLEGFDSAAYIEGAVPILGGIFAAGTAHEVGHMIAGAATNIKLSIPFLIPNGQLGSFGAVTQIKSLPKNRSDLFDVCFAGPLAGSLVAGSIFAYGLAMSVGGVGDDLLPVPAALFQGSLLLGAVSELVLGDAGDSAKSVMVHPLFIAGWCGLVTQALNCLPVGQIDGGRITQMGFGRRALGATSLGVYLGLSLGVIGSSLSLSWALYVLICQRTPEFSPQDDVTEVSGGRQQAALLLILVSLLILLPGVGAGAGADVMPML